MGVLQLCTASALRLPARRHALGIACCMALVANPPATATTGSQPTPSKAMDASIAQSFLERAQPVATRGTEQPIGKFNGATAMMVSGEDAQDLRAAAANMEEPEIPSGSDLDRLLNGESGPSRTVSSPLAHGN